MKSDELIRALVDELAPVRRLPSAGRRTLVWGGLALACVLSGTWALGPRGDLARKLGDPWFVGAAAASLLVFALSARRAFQLGVPGAAPAHGWVAPALMLAGWTLAVAVRPWNDGGLHGSGVACVLRMIGLALTPAIAAFFMLRRAAPLAWRWTGSFALLSAGALAIVGTQIVCAHDGPGHVLIWHGGPMLVAAWIARRGSAGAAAPVDQ